jgi:hypothetical protein
VSEVGVIEIPVGGLVLNTAVVSFDMSPTLILNILVPALLSALRLASKTLLTWSSKILMLGEPEIVLPSAPIQLPLVVSINTLDR